jgi:hypothetical protein
MRLVLLISMLAATLQADPITVLEAKSAFGVTDLFYSYNVPASPGPVTATIHGDASCFNNLSCGDQPATASIDLTIDFNTAGPIRDGIALVQLFITQSGGVIPDVSGAIGPYALGGCPSELDCALSGYFPFELGVPSTIHLSGLANGNPPDGSAGFGAFASLQLYELSTQAGDPAGAPVQIYLIPEPGSAGLAFTGLSALILFAVRRRNLPSRASLVPRVI